MPAAAHQRFIEVFDRMSIAHMPQPPAEGFRLQGDHLVITKPVTLTMPRTMEMLRALPPELWQERLEKVAELGTEHFRAADTSAAIQLLDERVGNIFEKLDQEVQGKLEKTLAADRVLAKKEVSETLRTFDGELKKAMSRYVDPNAPDALPALMGRRMTEISRAAMAEIDRMLQNGDQGVLAKQTETIVKTFREDLELLKRQVIERQAVHDLGTGKGRTLEEDLAGRLGLIARPLMGEVERVGDNPGLKRNKSGDLLLTVRGPFARGGSLKVVFEAKDRAVENGRFSLAAVRQACRQACENRGADIAVFVTDSPELLPEGRGFGTADGHFWVAWLRQGDDTALAVVVHLAVTEALARVGAADNECDVDAARREAEALLASLDRFDQMESSHNSAIKAIQKAGVTATELRAALVKGLSRLGTILSGN